MVIAHSHLVVRSHRIIFSLSHSYLLSPYRVTLLSSQLFTLIVCVLSESLYLSPLSWCFIFIFVLIDRYDRMALQRLIIRYYRFISSSQYSHYDYHLTRSLSSHSHLHSRNHNHCSLALSIISRSLTLSCSHVSLYCTLAFMLSRL